MSQILAAKHSISGEACTSHRQMVSIDQNFTGIEQPSLEELPICSAVMASPRVSSTIRQILPSLASGMKAVALWSSPHSRSR